MKEKAMKREHWACVGLGSGVTGAALYTAHGNVVGAMVFAAISVASLLALHSVDVRNSARQIEASGE